MKWKFRAWDKKNETMLDHNYLFNVDCSNEYPFLALIAGYYAGDINPISVEIMAFTGLTDRNGVEIYEGDIVSFIPCDKTITGAVHFDEGGFCIESYFLQAGLWSHEDFRGEVIGNIYENPELLESDNEIECMLKVEKQ